MEAILLWRSDLLTKFFMGFTIFGSETFYMLVLPIGYWCWQRKLFSHLIQMLCWGTITNQLLKSIWQIPRPNIPHLVDVVGSYSFPSGDIQVATVMLVTLAWHFKKSWLNIVVIFLLAGVGSSRIYFGVHYPIDVICGFGVGLLLVAISACITTRAPELPVTIPITTLIILSFAESILLPEETKILSVAATACLLGFVMGEQLSARKYSDQYSHNNNYATVLLTGIAGILGLLIIRTCLKFFGNFVSNQNLLFTFTRYFILGSYVSFGAFVLFQLITQNKSMKRVKKQ